mmetsp:Transcript_22424/g.57112  ORF Transcript_22424/g.57112 Transcript_22424/m.57112 type:complete len:225 (+) Transcript_22424:81-755(+)
MSTPGCSDKGGRGFKWPKEACTTKAGVENAAIAGALSELRPPGGHCAMAASSEADLLGSDPRAEDMFGASSSGEGPGLHQPAGAVRVGQHRHLPASTLGDDVKSPRAAARSMWPSTESCPSVLARNGYDCTGMVATRDWMSDTPGQTPSAACFSLCRNDVAEGSLAMDAASGVSFTVAVSSAVRLVPFIDRVASGGYSRTTSGCPCTAHSSGASKEASPKGAAC